MDDREFVRQFEALELPFEEWTHRAHVRLAYLYLEAHGFDEALSRARTGIQRYNRKNRVPEGPTSGYDETTTHALLRTIDAVRVSYADSHPVRSSEEFCDMHPQLMSKHVLRCFYTPGLRLHPAAKTEFVPPDLTPLPDPARAEITEVPWIRRRFPLSVSLAQAGQVLARLQGTPARLEEALSEIPQPLRTRRNHGSWSIQENAGHLADLEELWRARLDDFAAGRNELTPWEPTNERTELARHNESAIEKILSDFRSARGELVARARAIPREEYVRSAGHRRLKTRLRLLDHLFFVAEHDDHHLARILEETHRPDAGAR